MGLLQLLAPPEADATFNAWSLAGVCPIDMSSDVRVVVTLSYMLQHVERRLWMKRFVERLKRSMTNFIHFENG